MRNLDARSSKTNPMNQRLKRVWQSFLRPEIPEGQAASSKVWRDLDADLKTPSQVLGRHSAGCAATYGVNEACDFYCTACYLADSANHTPPLPFAEVKGQLDRIREHLGPWGNTQITAGEVTLLPRAELIRILRYCREIQLAPMLMTNGQTILKDPSYLEDLVVQGGLNKIAIHIDTTEKGRLGLKAKDREVDIHWIRDAFANLLRQTRKRTGRPLLASHTFTVTESNYNDIPDVMEWMLKNADAFRMLSLQPTAEVGRTREQEQVGNADGIWAKVQQGAHHALNPRTFQFGHPDCNQISLAFVLRWREASGAEAIHLVDVVREGETADRDFFSSLLNEGFAGFATKGETTDVVAARALGRLKAHPKLLLKIPAFCAARGYDDRKAIAAVTRAAIARRDWSIRPFAVVVHNFMSAHELETDRGKARLAACSFRVPVNGEMVSMCQLNGTTLRKSLNERDQERLVQLS